MVLVIDNYDSFTYNLVQYLGELGAVLRVVRNDALAVADVDRLDVERIVISPGPGRPEQAGITVDLIRAYAPRVPILGVCLGHQAIGIAFGSAVVAAPALLHGKTSTVEHDGRGVFDGLTEPFPAGRYHSLAVDRATVPDDLEVAATAREDGTIMAVRHRRWPVHGVQFHPESVLTGEGRRVLGNFLACQVP
ncbi:MAG: aminodeoxychorismate/anthranilate synthase component II [Acidobacteria bacterium]|nr:aminodeoxychorismate/anthranilate synthase component II [Chloroflexota bacterium]MYN67763.1 aminodeoxychorismate/anthranilate synthase component II [Acidobacteriota bacterium]